MTSFRSDFRVDARLATVEGKGVGRWRFYYSGETLKEAIWAARHLVPKAQVRVRLGREVVLGPMRAEQLQETKVA